MAGKKNGAYLEIEGMIRAYRARTGTDYASVWISLERCALLPEWARPGAIHWGGRLHHERFSIDGVPVRLIEVLPPQ